MTVTELAAKITEKLNSMPDGEEKTRLRRNLYEIMMVLNVGIGLGKTANVLIDKVLEYLDDV